VFWVFFRSHLCHPDDGYLLGGDAWVVTKSGKKTDGVDRFFSSLDGKPVPGLSFFPLSLMSTQQRRSYPTMVEPMVRTEAEKVATHATSHKKTQPRKTNAPQGQSGRPKGSKNKEKTPVTLRPELPRLQTMMPKQLQGSGGMIARTPMVLDGHVGNHPAVHMGRGCGLPLIAQLRHDAARSFPDAGPYAGRGPRRQDGEKLDYHNLPVQSLTQTTVEDHIHTCLYQAQL